MWQTKSIINLDLLVFSVIRTLSLLDGTKSEETNISRTILYTL